MFSKPCASAQGRVPCTRAAAQAAALRLLYHDAAKRPQQNRTCCGFAWFNVDVYKRQVLERAGGENGYIKTMWCGDLACEEMMKEKAGLSSRCMPFAQEHLSDVCPCCGKPAKAMVVWGKAY